MRWGRKGCQAAAGSRRFVTARYRHKMLLQLRFPANYLFLRLPSSLLVQAAPTRIERQPPAGVVEERGNAR
jgi:hypothetical protein